MVSWSPSSETFGALAEGAGGAAVVVAAEPRPPFLFQGCPHPPFSEPRLVLGVGPELYQNP